MSRLQITLLATLAVIALAGTLMVKSSAQSDKPDPQIAAAGTTAVVTLQRPAGAMPSLSATMEGETVLTLDLTLVKEDPSVPVALEITSACAAPCEGGQPTESVTLGQISLFPALRAGESRKVELQLAGDEAAKLAATVRVELKPLVEGRGVGQNAVKVNSAEVAQKPAQ